MAQDTVNVESESHVLGRGDLLLGHVLDLRSQEVTGDSLSGDRGVQTRHARRSWDRKRGTERVAGAPTVLHGGRQAQVVHELGGIANRAPGSGNLDGVAGLTTDRESGRSALTLIAGRMRASTALDGEVGIIKARHVEVVEKLKKYNKEK